MHRIQFLYIDPCLPSDFIGNTLSDILKLKTLSVGDMLRQQFARNDDLTLRMREYIDFGKIISPNLITELILVSINELQHTDILLLGYPKTLEQYQNLSKMLLDNNYEIGEFWYFEHKDSLQYFHKYYEQPKQKPYLDKYGDEVKQSWFKSIDKHSEDINQLYILTNQIKWNRIKVSYTDKELGLTWLQTIIDEHSDSI
jgi:adenylate kinase family enzyme